MLPEKMILKLIEKSVNHFLTYAISEMQMKPLSGKVIQMELNEFPFIFYWQFHECSITILEMYTLEPDAVIQGSFFSLFKLMNDDHAVFLGDKIHIKGDIHLAEQLRNILSQIDFDYEGYLGQYVGETPAHWLAIGIKQTIQHTKKLQKRFTQNTVDYLQTETHILPYRDEFSLLTQSVMTLQIDVDRLEARLNRLLKYFEHDHV